MHIDVAHEGWRSFDRVPVLPVALSAPLGRPWPDDYAPAHVFNAAIDTGSNLSYATPFVLDKLGVRASGVSWSTLRMWADAPKTVETFLLDLAIPLTGGSVVVSNLRVGQADLPPFRVSPVYHLLLGCDVLADVRLTIDGPRRLFRVERPS